MRDAKRPRTDGILRGAAGASALLIALCSGGCGPATCDDIECVMENLVLTHEGVRVPLTRVAGNLLPEPTVPVGGDDTTLRFFITPLSVPNWGDPLEILQAGKPAAPGMGTADESRTPTIKNALKDVKFDDPATEEELAIEFDDPNGATPAFCWRPADKDHAFAHAVWCTPSKRDLEISGTFIIRMRLNVFVPQGRAIRLGTATTITPSPIRPTPITATAISGTPVSLTVTPPVQTIGNTNNTQNEWSRCYSAPLNCPGTPCGSFQACASSGLAGCVTGGYLVNGTRFFRCANCSNCTAAAQAAVAFCCPLPR